MANVPPITRDPFLQALSQWVEIAKSECRHLGILLVDLKNLADINHLQGYDAGDAVLATAYNHLLGISKLDNTVFRVGSKRFAFLLPDLTNPGFILLAANKVTSVLGGELQLAGSNTFLELYVGVNVNQSGKDAPLSMLANAEINLHQVKLGKGDSYQALYSSGQGNTSSYDLEQHFVQSLKENDLELYFQPKINLSTNAVESAEALLRWRGLDGAHVPPEIVVSMATKLGLSFELTKWVVNRSLRYLQEWQDSLNIGLAINVQAGLVSNAEITPLLLDAVAIWNIDAEKLTVEITEDAIIEDMEAGFSNLKKLKSSGIKLSIDDFGTGYSSLSYFKQIPANELKIDKSFVTTMLADSQNLELVKIILQIAKEFGLVVVAEGVEDAATADCLRQLGCNYAQGYYFSRPLPAQEFEQWVRGRSE